MNRGGAVVRRPQVGAPGPGAHIRRGSSALPSRRSQVGAPGPGAPKPLFAQRLARRGYDAMARAKAALPHGRGLSAVHCSVRWPAAGGRQCHRYGRLCILRRPPSDRLPPDRLPAAGPLRAGAWYCGISGGFTCALPERLPFPIGDSGMRTVCGRAWLRSMPLPETVRAGRNLARLSLYPGRVSSTLGRLAPLKRVLGSG